MGNVCGRVGLESRSNSWLEMMIFSPVRWSQKINKDEYQKGIGEQDYVCDGIAFPMTGNIAQQDIDHQIEHKTCSANRICSYFISHSAICSRFNFPNATY